jgi:hypothetical protein
MTKPRLSILSFTLTLSLAAIALLPLGSYSSTCSGSDPCNACKNCRYCQHCAKQGEKCGVCK